MEAKGFRVDLSRAAWFKSSRSGVGRDPSSPRWNGTASSDGAGTAGGS